MEDFVGAMLVARTVWRRSDISVALAERIVDLVKDASQRAIRSVSEPKRDWCKLVEGVAREGYETDRTALKLNSRRPKLIFRPRSQGFIATRAVIFAVESKQAGPIDGEAARLCLCFIQTINVEIDQS